MMKHFEMLAPVLDLKALAALSDGVAASLSQKRWNFWSARQHAGRLIGWVRLA
jgi:hypothetical protein